MQKRACQQRSVDFPIFDARFVAFSKQIISFTFGSFGSIFVNFSQLF